MKIDLRSITEKIIQFRDNRGWAQYHDHKNLSQALSIEAAEFHILSPRHIPGKSAQERFCVRE